MNNSSSRDNPEPYLALAWTQEIFGLWEAAFLCCGLEPPLNPPSNLKVPPTVAKMAARIKDEVTACGRPTVTRGERRQDEAFEQARSLLRTERGEPAEPAETGGAATKPARSPEFRAMVRTFSRRLHNNRPDADLFFDRVDLRAWMNEPENAPLRELARFLYPPETENRDAGELTDREHEKLLVVIGALVRQFANTSNQLQHGKNPNMEQVFQRVCDEFTDEQGNIPHGYAGNTVKERLKLGLAALERLQTENDKPSAS